MPSIAYLARGDSKTYPSIVVSTSVAAPVSEEDGQDCGARRPAIAATANLLQAIISAHVEPLGCRNANGPRR